MSRTMCHEMLRALAVRVVVLSLEIIVIVAALASGSWAVAIIVGCFAIFGAGLLVLRLILLRRADPAVLDRELPPRPRTEFRLRWKDAPGPSPGAALGPPAAVAATTLARLIVSVESLDRALEFYGRALGLELRWRADPIAVVGNSDLEVMLHERPPSPSEAGIAPSFRVRDVDETTRAAVAAGARIIDAPADQPWGERQSVLLDPDGHLVCIVAVVVSSTSESAEGRTGTETT